jgi:ABC-type phosphate/phosphonate transport system substrate-binding protein
MCRQLATWAVVMSGAALLASFGVGPDTLAAEKGDAKTIRVGLVNTLFHNDSEKQIQSMAGPFKSLMEEKAGVIGEVVLGGDPENLAVELKDGKVGLGVFHGFEYAWARQKNPDLKPLMIGVNRRPFVRAVIVVRQDEKIADPTGLQGKALGMPHLAREEQRIFVERRLVAPGMTMDKWFSKVATPRTPQDALDDLGEKAVDAVAVDETDLADYGKKFPKSAGRLRVLKESEKFPPVTVAYHPGRQNQDTLDKLRDGMIEANKTERGRKLIDLCRLTGFDKVPADFDQSLAEIAKAYPPPTKK